MIDTDEVVQQRFDPQKGSSYRLQTASYDRPPVWILYSARYVRGSWIQDGTVFINDLVRLSHHFRELRQELILAYIEQYDRATSAARDRQHMDFAGDTRKRSERKFRESQNESQCCIGHKNRMLAATAEASGLEDSHTNNHRILPVYHVAFQHSQHYYPWFNAATLELPVHVGASGSPEVSVMGVGSRGGSHV